MSIGGFNLLWNSHEGATHASWSEFCLVFSLIIFTLSNADRECVATTLKICSFSDIHSSPDRDVRAGKDLYCTDPCPHRSLPARTSRSMSTVYRRYAGFSPASKGSAMLSQSKQWSGGCRVCRTCSAAHGCFLTMLINCLEAAPVCCLKTLANYHQRWIPLGTRHCCEPFYLISAVQHTNFLTVPLSLTM